VVGLAYIIDMQHSLFSDGPTQHTMLGCMVEHHSRFVQDVLGGETVAEAWMSSLKDDLAWQQDTIRLFGKSHLIPRLNAWYGDDGTDFAYSGIPLKPIPWTKELSNIRMALFQHTGINFNSVLANLYRNGFDKMGWHSDDESQMCPQSPIASLSLGVSRKMQFKSKDSTNRERLEVLLEHGDLLVMYPPTQEVLKHCIPVMRKVTAPRINLTFRRHLPILGH